MPEDADAGSPYQPKTALGRQLIAIRSKIIISGEPLLGLKVDLVTRPALKGNRGSRILREVVSV